MGSRVCKSLLGDRPHEESERTERAERTPDRVQEGSAAESHDIVGFSGSFVQMLGTPETSDATLRLRNSSPRAF